MSKKSCFGESEILVELPRPTVIALIYEVYAKDIQDVNLFRTYEKSFVTDLITNARPFEVMKGERIFDEGDVLNDIIFITSGSIEMTKFYGTMSVTLGLCHNGGFFGDFEFLKNTCSIVTYSATKNCSLLAISHSVVTKAMKNNLECGDRFHSELQQRYKHFMQIALVPKSDEKKPVVKNSLNKITKKLRSAAKQQLDRLQTPVEQSKDSQKGVKKSDACFELTNIWIDGILFPRIKETNLTNFVGKNPNVSTYSQACKVITVDDNGEERFEDIELDALLKMFVVHPKDPRKVYWDLFLGLLVIFIVLLAPLDIAFDSEVYGVALDYVDIIVCAIFTTDILISFRTAYYVKDHDAYSIVPSDMYNHYLRTWFTIDLVSTVPIDLILSFLSGASSAAKLIKLLRLMRLTKLARVLKLKIYIARLEAVLGLPPSMFDFFSLLLKVMFSAHYLACFWWGICSIMSSPGARWFEGNGIYDGSNVRGTPLRSEYLWSLYWTVATLTTVGYGDATSSNTAERILNIFILFLGASLFGYVVANVSSVLDTISRKSTILADRFAQISEYLKEKDCPPDLSQNILRHFRLLYGLENSMEGKEVLARLPLKLKNKILLIQYDSKIKNIAIFKYVANSTVRLYLFGLMKPIFFQSGQTVIMEGESASDILFFVSGSAIAVKFHDSSVVLRQRRKSSNKGLLSVHDNSQRDSTEDRVKNSHSSDDLQLFRRTFVGGISGHFPRGSPSTRVKGSLMYRDGFDTKLPEEDSVEVIGDALRDKPSPIVKKSNRKSFISRSAFQEPKEDSQNDSSSSGKTNEFADFLLWKEDAAEMRRRKLITVGEIKPGMFIGHVALMDRGKHRVSAIASSTSCAYSLSSVEISRLIRIEPTVAVQFQHALSSAIRDQSHLWGKVSMINRKKVFIRNIKQKFYLSRDGPSSKGNPSTRMSRSLLSKFSSVKIVPKETISRRPNSAKSSNSEPSSESIHRVFNLETILSESKIDHDSDSEEEKNRQHQSIANSLNLHSILPTFRLKDKNRKLLSLSKAITQVLSTYTKHKKINHVRSFSCSDILPTSKHSKFSLVGGAEENKSSTWDNDSTELSGVSERYKDRRRRQSFPSLDTAHWKAATTQMGLV